MKESVVKSMMELFALIANVSERGVSGKAREIVEAYLRRRINQEAAKQYVAFFDKLIAKRQHEHKPQQFDRNEVKRLCNYINSILHQKEKIIVLVRLVEFVYEDGLISSEENQFITQIARHFNIRREELDDIITFIQAGPKERFTSNQFLTVDNVSDAERLGGEWFARNIPETVENPRHIYKEGFPGRIVVLYVASVQTFFYRYYGHAELFFNNRTVIPYQIFVFDHGGIIKGTKISPLYYTDLAVFYTEKHDEEKITLTVEEASFKFKSGPNGIKPFSLQEESGQLIGIMGGSGTGKSTLLNLLNGKLKPAQGRILINGYDIHKYKFEGSIGYVPQDDLLIEELTVFQNLYFNAKLSLSAFPESLIIQRVVKTLKNFDLFEVKDLQVGNPINKKISGGQRKRLNIALEMIREPSILYIDEPTSGLSSADSESMMLLLKEQTLKNKLVFANIHQPSSDIFKLLDKLIVIDRGGYIIYYGNPLDAVVYFKTAAEFINASESECPTCGNVNPEQILNIVELKEVNEFGRFTENRRVSPEIWHQIYHEKIASNYEAEPVEKVAPKQVFRAPNYWHQFKIFLDRNILSKLADHQYLLITFLEAPFLAFLLGYFTKYIAGTHDDPHAYLFIENSNLPAYLFMAVVVALFLGLTVSAEEIIRDKRILERESFLDLSRFSYINSKIVVLMGISAIQSASFVLIGNTILEIQSLWFEYWIVLFTTSVLANLVGLNISSALNSVVTIYITIPFILVPQLLLSGTIVNFDKLNEDFANKQVTPILGDLMPSRWAYEALAVTQFKENPYMREIFEYELPMQSYDFMQSFLIGKLESKLDMAELQKKLKKEPKQLQKNLLMVQNELRLLAQHINLPQFEFLSALTPQNFDSDVKEEAFDYLEYLKRNLQESYDSLRHKKELHLTDLNEKLKKDGYGLLKLKRENYNKQLANFVTKRHELIKTEEYNNRIIRKKDPIFMLPESYSGRAHFYAPFKRLGAEYIPTIWFNVGILWVMSILLYLTLYFDTLKHILRSAMHVKYFFERLKKRFVLPRTNHLLRQG